MVVDDGKQISVRRMRAFSMSKAYYEYYHNVCILESKRIGKAYVKHLDGDRSNYAEENLKLISWSELLKETR